MTFPYLPTRPADLQKTAETVNELLNGRMNVTGTVTLRASQTTTVIPDNLLETNTVLLLVPTTANAAGALATTYVSAKAKGSFTLTHASAVSTDRTFDYVRLG